MRDKALPAGVTECSDWAWWMQAHLAEGGIEPPGDDTCLRFAATSIKLADRVHRIYKHLPVSGRDLLIQASIMHQCWARQVGIGGRGQMGRGNPVIPTVEAVEIVGDSVGSELVIAASDGHRYEVKLGSSRKTAMATQVICSVTAAEMGLPVPPLAVILVGNHQRVSPRFRGNIRGGLGLLANGKWLIGTKKIDEIGPAAGAEPGLPLSRRSARYSAGSTVFNILTLNINAKRERFQRIGNQAEQFFTDFEECLMGGNWDRFEKTNYREHLDYDPSAAKITSYEQLETWVRRAEAVNLDRVCEIVVKLPPDMYTSRPLSVAAVLGKLGHRAHDLRRAILHLIDKGYFPCIGKPKRRDLDTVEWRTKVRKASAPGRNAR